jgi:hypothetical protein
MAARLRMSAELGDWLAELCTFAPGSAAEVGAAVTAMMTAADPTALALVETPAADRIDPREELDTLYQAMLEAFQQVRFELADAATARAGAERLVTEAHEKPEADPAVRAWLSQAVTDARRHEAEVAKKSRSIQAEVDRFRTAKETAKAMYTAAEASLRIRDAVEAAADEGSIGAEQLGAERTVQVRAGQSAPEDDLAQLNAALEAAEAHLEAVATEAYRIFRSLQRNTGTGPQADQEPLARALPVAGLLELRADPLGRDVRLLLAVEPADTVTVLAVLDGEDAISAHRNQAIQLAGDLLTDIRAGDWPPADALGAADLEVTFADSATFLERFFPADHGAIGERAADLAAAQSLTGLRGGMSIADLSVETGISEDRLRDIETRGLRVAEVHEAVAYVRALGGRLVLAADFDEPPPTLLT